MNLIRLILACVVLCCVSTLAKATCFPQSPTKPTSNPQTATRPSAADRAEFNLRLSKLPKGDVGAMVSLAKWGIGASLEKESQALLKKVLEATPDHAEARELLGFVRIEGKWVNRADQERAAKAKEEAEAKKKGLVRFGEEWVPKQDLPFLQKGLVRYKDEWVTKEEKEKLAAGWRRLDTELIPPDEASNIEKELFKINGNWVSLQDADAHHASEATPWQIPTKHFLFQSTVGRKEIERLQKKAETTYETLHQLLGVEPATRIKVTLFGSMDAANAYAQQAGASDHSSVWPGYVSEKDPERPTVALYDRDFGHLYVAHAAAHKYLDDVIPDAERLPAWFEEGLVVYAERYGDVELRNWSIERLVARGGFSHVAEATDKFRLTADDVKASQTRLFEVGLIVAYLAGNSEKADSEKFKKALSSLNKPAERDAAIQRIVSQPADLDKHIRKFAGVER